jgi:hypothetical protein
MRENYSFEYRAAAPVREGAGHPGAAVLFHAGACHFVTHRSAAERELLAAGALHLGLLRFDRPAAAATARLVRLGAAPAWGSMRN